MNTYTSQSANSDWEVSSSTGTHAYFIGTNLA